MSPPQLIKTTLVTLGVSFPRTLLSSQSKLSSTNTPSKSKGESTGVNLHEILSL